MNTRVRILNALRELNDKIHELHIARVFSIPFQQNISDEETGPLQQFDIESSEINVMNDISKITDIAIFLKKNSLNKTKPRT